MQDAVKPIFIVSASPDPEETFSKSYLYKAYQRLLRSHQYQELLSAKFFFDNKVGLSKLYNQFLTPQYAGQIVVFVHDDVSIQDLMFCSKLRSAHREYDVVGLAGGDGAKSHDPSIAPLWHIMSEQRFGAVAHPTEQDGAVTVAAFGPTPRPCKYIDGLFISIDVDKALAKDLKFDEDFDFHFYDLALCERTTQKQMKVGVWPIWVVHQGLGDSYQSESWQNNARKFIKKYRGRTV
jgi:hypothetical protein